MPLMTPARWFVMALLFTVAPMAAEASIHADFGDAGILAPLIWIWQAVGVLGGLAMLTAGVLFWRRGMASAVLACLAIQTLPGVLSRILIWAYQANLALPGSSSKGIAMVFSMIGGTVTVLQWTALGVALVITLRRQPAPDHPSAP
ncbi:MAG: hypothetical protein IPK97_11100 [Ahniella sp.]|nr:hypothetical protein [Ahniella sp.]